MLYKYREASYLFVRHAMVVEVRAGRESLATYRTFVWFFTAVYAPVCVERTGRRKRFEAYVTRVRFLTCNHTRKHVTWCVISNT